MSKLDAIRTSADMGNMVILMVIIALAFAANWTINQSASAPVIATSFGICETAIVDCAMEYSVCIRDLRYTSRAARSHIRAMVRAKYNFKPEVQRQVLRHAVDMAYSKYIDA